MAESRVKGAAEVFLSTCAFQVPYTIFACLPIERDIVAI
jgi:hypothetical protein